MNPHMRIEKTNSLSVGTHLLVWVQADLSWLCLRCRTAMDILDAGQGTIIDATCDEVLERKRRDDPDWSQT